MAVEWYELLQDARSSDCERVDARTRSAGRRWDSNKFPMIKLEDRLPFVAAQVMS